MLTQLIVVTQKLISGSTYTMTGVLDNSSELAWVMLCVEESCYLQELIQHVWQEYGLRLLSRWHMG